MKFRSLFCPLLCLLFFRVHAAEPVPNIQRFHQYGPNFSISGQPKRNQFAAIAAAGYKVVINVASADSNPDAVKDEKQLVEAEGMEYHHFPLKWEKPDAGEAVAAVKLLEQLKDKPTLLHCFVGSRASLMNSLILRLQLCDQRSDFWA